MSSKNIFSTQDFSDGPKFGVQICAEDSDFLVATIVAIGRFEAATEQSSWGTRFKRGLDRV